MSQIQNHSRGETASTNNDRADPSPPSASSALPVSDVSSTVARAEAPVPVNSATASTTVEMSNGNDEIFKGAVERNADSEEDLDDSSTTVEPESLSAIDELNKLYQQMTVARDPTLYLTHFSAYFQQIFNFKHDNPAANRAVFNSDANLHYFIKIMVPNLVRFFLTMDPTPHPRLQAPIIQRFLQACIVTCIHAIHFDCNELLLTLAQLLGAPVIDRSAPAATVSGSINMPRSFYVQCGQPKQMKNGEVGWEEDTWVATDKLQPDVVTRIQRIAPAFPAAISPASAGVTSAATSMRTFVGSTGKRVLNSSWYLLQNVQFFGEQGGFHCIAERIKRASAALKQKSKAASGSTNPSSSPTTAQPTSQPQSSPTSSTAPTSASSSSTSSASSASTDENHFSLSLVHLIHLLNPLVEIRFLLIPSFIQAYVLEIKDAVFGYLLSLDCDDDLLKSINRKMLSRPLLQVELLMNVCQPTMTDAEIRKYLELFELDFSWMYVKNKAVPLDRRINAMNDIKDVIDCTEKKEEYFRKKSGSGSSSSSQAPSVLGYVNAAVTNSLNMNEPAPAYTKIWMSNESLCKWIIANRVVEELLDTSTAHIELIRRSLAVLRALSLPSSTSPNPKGSSNPPLLSPAHLDLLWQLSCIGKHESVEHLIYDIVAKLSPSLPAPLMNHLFQRMCEKPMSTYDTIFLTLLYNFTLAALSPNSAVAQAASKGEAQQTYGLELFWKLLQIDSRSSQQQLSEEVRTRAQKYFLDLLQLDQSMEGLRLKYLDRCIANIKVTQQQLNVTQALQLLLKILQMFPMKSSGWFGSGSSQTQPAVIENLEQKYGLLNLILNEIQAFQARASKEFQQQAASSAVAVPSSHTPALSPPSSASSSPSPSSAASALKQYQEQIEIREEALVSILTHSNLTLSKSQLDLVWQSLVIDCHDQHVKDGVFAWLIDGCGNDEKILKEEEKSYLFQSKLLTLHAPTMSSMAFKLFLQYFLNIFAKNGTLKVDENVVYPLNKTNGGTSEFDRVLAKHRSGLNAPSTATNSKASSNSLPSLKPQLISSASELSAAPIDYASTTDEDQLAKSPQFESSLLARTQRLCNAITVLQYNDNVQICISFLWEIVLKNVRARVARQSIILLNSLHQNLSGKSRSANESPSSIRDAYLKQCLSHMSQSLQEAASQSNGSSRPGSMQGLSELAADLQAKKKVSRCIYMLKTYLNAFLNKPAVPSSSSSAPADGSLSLHIIPTREYRIEPFDITLKKSDTIGELRTAVFAHLSTRNPNISQKSMLMMWDSKKLLTNYIVLGNVGFKNGDSVLVKRNSDLFGSYQPSAAVYTNPSATLFTSLFFDVLDEPWQDMQGREKYLSASIMERSVVNEDSDRSWSRKAQDADSTLASIASDPASFDRLFSLLSANSPISESVFDILMLLPTNMNSLRTFLQIQSLNPDKWGMILDVKSMYRLLYSLQVIEEIISPRMNANNRNVLTQALGPDAARNFDLSQWCVHFIQKGGVKYLAQLIIHFSAPPASPVRTAAASSKRSGSGVVPRAIYNEVLQSLFTLLHYFFSFDPNWSIPTSSISTTTAVTSPSSASSASAASMIHLPAGSWFKLPNWESWLKQVVKEGIIPAMMQAFSKADHGSADSQNNNASEENTTSMLIAGSRLLLGCVQAVPSILESVCYKQENQTLELLTVLLMKSSSEAVRTQAAQTFFNIFKLAVKQQQQPQASPQYSLFWLNIMQQLLTSPSLLANGNNSQEFFLLYTSYLELLLTSNVSNAQMKLSFKQHLQSSVLFSTSTQLLREHGSTEQYEQYLKVDMFLTGILQLLRSCVTYKLVDASAEGSLQDPQSPLIQLVAYVYNECLFFTPADDAAQGAKCKTHSSRIMAFGLLLELASVFEACYARLLEKVAHDRVWMVARNSTQWGYDPTQLEKNTSVAPLGLKNQGATCYMNSFLQVLFSAKEFRQAIMSLKTDSDALAAAESAKIENKSSAVVRSPAARSARGSALRELQLLFGHLAWSQKSFFDAIDFCYSLKDYNGMPLNIAEQKDVNEFASLLFDQIEQDMNLMCKPLSAPAADADSGKIVPARAADTNTVSKKVIEHTFKGSLVHQIISQNNSECPHTTCREEPFYMISLTVVNKTSMEQSLAGFIEGDLLDGDNKYLCNLCNKKVAALKRCCFHDTNLPQYLIMHLKRFEFNFDQFVKVKVNDYFSFPYKDGEYLNIERFTQSGLAKAEASSKGGAANEASSSSKPEGFYDYELVGVLIHGGSAEGGHYVTLCKTEISVDPTSAAASTAGSSASVPGTNVDGPTSAFYEFNDQVVRPFDPASIPASCFGGVEKVEVYDKLKNTTVMKDVTNIKNAYMCIYKRRWKPSAEEEAQEAAAVVAASTAPVADKKLEDVDDDAAPSLPSTPRTDDLLDKNEDEAKVEDIVMYVDTAPTTQTSSIVHTPASDSESLSPLPSSSSSSTTLQPVGNGPRSIWSYDRSRNDLSHFPTEVLESVWQDNLSFLHDKYLFDWNMNWFMWNLLQLHLPAAQTSSKTNGILAPTTSNAGDQSWSALHGAMLGQIGIKFVFQVLARSADNASFPQWIDLLYQLVDWDVNARTWFLQALIEENAQGNSELSPFFLQLMFDCPQQIVREAFGDFIVFVVSAAREDKNERALYFDSIEEGVKAKANATSSPALDANGGDKSTHSSGSTLAAPTADHLKFSLAPTSRSSSPAIPPASSSASPLPHRSRVIRLLRTLLDFIPHVKKHHRTYKEYWRMMYQLAKIGSDERKWLVQQGAIRVLIQFYLDAEPLTGFNVTSPYGSDPPRRKHVTSSFWMLHLLSLLIRSCETDALPKAGLAPSQSQRNLVQLSPEERQLILTGWAFPVPVAEAGSPPVRTLFPWCLSDRQNPVAICELCVHWCWEQLSVSCKLIDVLIKQIIQELTSVADMAEYKLLFKLYMCVLTIGDSVATQTSRVEYGLNELFSLLKKVVVRAKVGDEKLLFFATQHVLKLAYQSKCAAAWLTKNENRYASWWNEYRQSHVDGPSNNRS